MTKEDQALGWVRIVAGYVVTVLGWLVFALALVTLAFACSPANGADAPGLLRGGGSMLGVAVVLLGLGWVLRKEGAG